MAVIGLAAHVDAGKTTLSESMLFLSGALRRQGRVDHGDTFLDTDAMEKERGITIFSKEARLTWKKANLTLIDTPGHADFSGEAERAVSVMDAAVLVVSAPDGVQSHTRTLWRLLEKNRIPVILFVNKMDYFQGDIRSLQDSLRQELSDAVVPFPDPDPERVALCDERVLDAYLREGEIPDRLLYSLFAARKIVPCFFGSALRNEGVEPLLDFLSALPPAPPAADRFGALVYKVARDPQGARLTFLKVTSGVLKTRDLLSLHAPEGETLWSEKAAELRLYSGARFTPVPAVSAGEVCCVVGLSKALPGDGLGTGVRREAPLLRPCYSCRLLPAPGSDLHQVLNCLQILEEEEPLIRTEYVEARREIRVHSMGDVYLEVLRRQMKDRFGFDVSFTDSSVLYRETIEAPVEGVGHYEPLRHYAEVHLLLSPLPRGSGLVCDSAVSVDNLALNWQRLILTHLREKVHVGVLTGSPVTDLRITLVAGKAHLKHTEGGDFRQATYRALRQGLMKARSVLLEPWVALEIRIPEEYVGRVLNDLSLMGGRLQSPEPAGPGFSRLTAEVPAAACADYGRQLAILTKGSGSLSTSLRDWAPCAQQDKIVTAKAYDPRADLFNSPDSVFCSHGAGYVVPWNEVENYMHLPLLSELKSRQAETPAAGGSATAYRGTREEDLALEKIFEKTYGPVKARQLLPQKPETPSADPKPSSPAAPESPQGTEILLVDGYNVLYAWDEWKPYLDTNLEGARRALQDLLCNYAGATGHAVILVFDAYRVPGNPGSAEKYHNIWVVYTREAQTADAYIEQSTYFGRSTGRVRVVTSDRPEQLIASGNAALRISAREFHDEVNRVRGGIAAFLKQNNRPLRDKPLERAMKEAWKKKVSESGK